MSITRSSANTSGPGRARWCASQLVTLLPSSPTVAASWLSRGAWSARRRPGVPTPNGSACPRGVVPWAHDRVRPRVLEHTVSGPQLLEGGKVSLVEGQGVAVRQRGERAGVLSGSRHPRHCARSGHGGRTELTRVARKDAGHVNRVSNHGRPPCTSADCPGARRV
jgi:hypothetical protein